MTTRSFESLESSVGQAIANAVEVIERLGGRQTHDSGHAKSPTWIYSFRAHQEAQVALRINQEKLSVYVRATPHGRKDFERAVEAWAEIEQAYPNPEEKPASSLLSENHAAFLTPRSGKLLRLRVEEGQLEPLLRAYLPTKPLTPSDARDKVTPAVPVVDAAASEELVKPSGPASGPDASDDSPSLSRAVSPEQLRQSLDRNDATGKAGERLAYAEELARLLALGCPDPGRYVRLIADENVAAGYDLHSEWSGELRCIEVKTTVSGRERIFTTENERRALKALGGSAWLYRVDLSAGEGGAVTMRLQDPMTLLDATCFQPVVWSIDVGAFHGDVA